MLSTHELNIFRLCTYLSSITIVIMKKFVASLLLISVSYIAPSYAQKVKIGFAQSDYILGLLPEAGPAEQSIATFERELSNKITAMRQGLELQVAQFRQEAPTLSDSARAERETELQQLQQDIRQEQQTAEQQLQFKVMQSLSPLRQKVQYTIDSVAQANGYTHVFPTDIDGQPFLIYAKDTKEADVTALVLKALNITPPADTTGQ